MRTKTSIGFALWETYSIVQRNRIHFSQEFQSCPHFPPQQFTTQFLKVTGQVVVKKLKWIERKVIRDCEFSLNSIYEVKWWYTYTPCPQSRECMLFIHKHSTHTDPICQDENWAGRFISTLFSLHTIPWAVALVQTLKYSPHKVHEWCSCSTVACILMKWESLFWFHLMEWICWLIEFLPSFLCSSSL